MRLYRDYIMFSELQKEYKGRMPSKIKKQVRDERVLFGRLLCVQKKSLPEELKDAAANCTDLTNLYPTQDLGIELGFYMEYFKKSNPRKSKQNVPIVDLTNRDTAIPLTDTFLKMINKGLQPYRIDDHSGINFSFIVDFYGIPVGFYDEDIDDTIDDPRFIYKDANNWTVDFPLNGVSRRFGGNLSAALSWRNEKISAFIDSEHPSVTRENRLLLVDKPEKKSGARHSTGYKGVHLALYRFGKHGESVCFAATYGQSGKNYSILKYGFNEAFRLAVNERMVYLSGIGLEEGVVLDTSIVRERLREIGREHLVGYGSLEIEERKIKKASLVRSDNNTGIDGVIFSLSNYNGQFALVVRSRYLKDGKEHSVSCSVKKRGAKSALKQAAEWRLKIMGRSGSFDEKNVNKDRLNKWLQKDDKTLAAVKHADDAWLNEIMAEVRPATKD